MSLFNVNIPLASPCSWCSCAGGRRAAQVGQLHMLRKLHPRIAAEGTFDALELLLVLHEVSLREGRGGSGAAEESKLRQRI